VNTHSTRHRNHRRTTLGLTLAAFGLVATACGGDDGNDAAAPTTAPTADASAATDGGPFGPACDAVPADGEGSFGGMADDPAATAASNNPVLSTLVAAVGQAGLVDTLNGDGPFTIFAPTDDAFAAVPTDQLDAVLADTDLLTSVLTYHVVGGQSLDAAGLAAAGTLETVNGATLELGADGTTVNGVDVVCSNVMTSNATVHIVDGVLLPPAGDDMDDMSDDMSGDMSDDMSDDMSGDKMSEDAMSDEMSDEMSGEMSGDGMALMPSGAACAAVPTDGEGSFDGMADDPAATAASNNPVLSTLVAAVSAAGLVDTLNGEGPFTIFAPTDDAFAAIPEADLNAVLADQDLLTSILTLHVVAGERMSSADLIAAGSVDTVNGGTLEITDDGGTLTVGGVASVCMDVPTANATVHIIEGVLLP
jgi:transforming growth factor-beta-induced protein